MCTRLDDQRELALRRKGNFFSPSWLSKMTEINTDDVVVLRFSLNEGTGTYEDDDRIFVYKWRIAKTKRAERRIHRHSDTFLK